MCAWETGNQVQRKSQLISNEELAKIPGYLEEREAKLLFYQFLRNNTTFATDLITGVKLFPFTKDDSENRIITIKRLFWIEGVKWQQERMYSEEEVFNLCREFAIFVQRNGPSYKKQQEWFEQFKRKA